MEPGWTIGVMIESRCIVGPVLKSEDRTIETKKTHNGSSGVA